MKGGEKNYVRNVNLDWRGKDVHDEDEDEPRSFHAVHYHGIAERKPTNGGKRTIKTHSTVKICLLDCGFFFLRKRVTIPMGNPPCFPPIMIIRWR